MSICLLHNLSGQSFSLKKQRRLFSLDLFHPFFYGTRSALLFWRKFGCGCVQYIIVYTLYLSPSHCVSEEGFLNTLAKITHMRTLQIHQNLAMNIFEKFNPHKIKKILSACGFRWILDS